MDEIDSRHNTNPYAYELTSFFFFFGVETSSRAHGLIIRCSSNRSIQSQILRWENAVLKSSISGHRSTVTRNRIRHHPLELLEVDVPIAVLVHRLDHPGAVLAGAPGVEPVEHQVELLRGDQAVPVPVVQVEGVADLGLGGGGGGAGPAEGGELGGADEAVLVGVDVLHGAADVGGGGGGAGGGEDTGELGGGDLAVAVAVELVEDLLELALAGVLEAEAGRLGRHGGRTGASTDVEGKTKKKKTIWRWRRDVSKARERNRCYLK